MSPIRNPWMVTTNQAYGVSLDDLKKTKSQWWNVTRDDSFCDHQSEHEKQQHNMSFLFSRESDKYGTDIPSSDSCLAKALSEQTSLSARAKRKTFSSSFQQLTSNPVPSRLSKGQMENWINQYSLNKKQEHILYSTTSNQIGSKKPTLATLPTTRYDISQQFSSSFHTVMFHDHSLNVALSRSKVHKSLDPSFT